MAGGRKKTVQRSANRSAESKYGASPAAAAIARIEAATAKSQAAHERSVAVREEARSRMEKRGMLTNR